MEYHRKRDRQMDRKKEGGREDAVLFFKKEDKSLIHVENGETTGEICCHLSLPNTIEHFIVYLRSSE